VSDFAYVAHTGCHKELVFLLQNKREACHPYVEARAAGAATLTDAEVADFVARFMPAYVAYLPGLYDAGPGAEVGSAGADAGGSVLTIRVDAERNVI
jgi:pantothenate kinase-related protein Tda10